MRNTLTFKIQKLQKTDLETVQICSASGEIRHYWKKLGLPWWLSGKEPAWQCRRCRFDPWVRKILWRRKWQPTLVFLPGKSHDRGAWWVTVHGVTKESDTTEWLNSSKKLLEIDWQWARHSQGQIVHQHQATFTDSESALCFPIPVSLMHLSSLSSLFSDPGEIQFLPRCLLLVVSFPSRNHHCMFGWFCGDCNVPLWSFLYLTH